ncbi:hypothetical protein [Bacillus velezensis]|uniref:hypothetical protein n=1 Tax=Bacillus velezensis TaxID=492670 RepID=UPI00084A1525|nr:hypothetical protein [Bacillus velezensis]AOO60311.1 hypothetical protein BBJ33_01630 [Bacillus velezensis]
MIIWINGAFGSGKTQTAFELHRRLKPSYVYDPEKMGFAMRSMIPPDIAWAAKQIDRCINSLSDSLFTEHLHTDQMSIQQAAETIAAQANLPLEPDSRGSLRRFTDKLMVKLNHIRIK